MATSMFILSDTFSSIEFVVEYCAASRSASKVKIQSTTGEPLTMREVRVFSNGVNVAIGKNATQSSDLDGTKVATKAVDDKWRTYSSTGDGCSKWWEVDLGESFPIDKVLIVNLKCSNDPECACKNSYATVSLLDANGEWVDVKVLGNSCSKGWLVRKFPKVCWNQVGQDIDGKAAGAKFGYSTDSSADGLTFVAGALSANKARVYQWNGAAWEQKGEDLLGTAANNYLGEVVAISSDGNIIAVGESGDDQVATNAGAVLVYEWDSTNSTWELMGPKILGKAAHDWTGTGPQSIDLSSDGMTIAVGASDASVNGVNNAGHVTVYRYDNSGSSPAWEQVGQEIQGTEQDDWVGWTLSLSDDGQTLAVNGDMWHEDAWAGYVRVYKLSADGTTWEQVGQDMDIQAKADGDRFGESFDLSGSGTTLVVGAPYADDNGNNRGYVQVYNWNSASGAWEQAGQDIFGEAAGDYWGYSVSISSDGMTFAAGGDSNDGVNGVDSGHVRVFKWNSSDEAWEQVGPDIDGEAAGDNSSYLTSISSDGTKVAIGAFKNDGAGGADSGHVRVFELGN